MGLPDYIKTATTSSSLVCNDTIKCSDHGTCYIKQDQIFCDCDPYYLGDKCDIQSVRIQSPSSVYYWHKDAWTVMGCISALIVLGVLAICLTCYKIHLDFRARRLANLLMAHNQVVQIRGPQQNDPRPVVQQQGAQDSQPSTSQAQDSQPSTSQEHYRYPFSFATNSSQTTDNESDTSMEDFAARVTVKRQRESLDSDPLLQLETKL